MNIDSSLASTRTLSSTIVQKPQINKEKTIEQRYQKKTPIDHILHRPESYIGSVQLDVQSLWVWSDKDMRMVFRPVNFVPGLYKIFDEILVNAADVKAREDNEKVSRQRMTYLKVDIDREIGSISICNDGEGIPIEVHKEHSIYVPELIFGHLLTSDNYDDTEQRVTGGRNGYGAKLTNIFSKTFTVECVDSARKRKFKKTWRNNMSTSDQVKITDCKDGKDYVKVTFIPDLKRFGVETFDDDFVNLLTKRVYDIAGCSAVKVWLNGRKLGVENFKSYVDLYFKQPSSSATDGLSPEYVLRLTTHRRLLAKPPLKIHEKSHRWEIVISASDGQCQQVSFVNSISTSKGGSHVNYVLDPLVQAILKKVNTKNKGGMDIKAHHVKAHIWIFLNCLIVNPTFDSQTKETLTLKTSQFGSKFTLADKTINAVAKSEILESVLLWAKTKEQVELHKKMKGASGKTGRDRISGMPKLEDANDAGTKYSENCTLILTEGESAKTSCVAGLSVVGRDRYGVYPLRGKLLNVREASFKQQVENQEIQAILKIMGLQVGKKIDSPKGLRYGSLMMMADQDLDGSHIKGLLINMIAHYWPLLLEYRGFLKQFVSKKTQQLAFFTLVQYEEWRKKNNGGRGWKIRYYKGLGTSTDKEFKEYFTQLEKHSLDFVYEGPNDINAIDMAFNGKRAEDRKQWIQRYQDGTYVDHSKPTITYSDFINKELVVFSKYDAFRSIPNCIDGLKPVQRKVLFGTFKKNIKTEIKVAQLTGYISETTAYHHGEQSLGTTIVGMAQTFVGSNNINLLQPCGQFGSRKEGGKDSSAVRYIFTRLSHMARAIFPEADDALLEYLNEDGLMVEPKFYVPVIPLALANGVEGIGTGWSTSVPNYNPQDIIRNIRKFMRGEPMDPMTPWYRGFKGRIEPKGSGGFESVGVIKKLDDETLEISELPVKVWTQVFKQFLEEALNDGSAHENSENQPTGRGRGAVVSNSLCIMDYRDNSTHESIMFTIKMTPGQMEKAEREGLEKAFKLRKPISTTNMTLFDPSLKVQRYLTDMDIIREFGQLRLQYYELRRSYLIEKLERECRIFSNKARFIKAVVAGTLIIGNRKKDDIIHDLLSHKFDTITAIHRASKVIWRLEEQRRKIESELNQEDADVKSEESDAEFEKAVAETSQITVAAKEFEYLLGMSLWTLSMEKINDLKAQMNIKEEELKKLIMLTPEDLWESDLVILEKALQDQDAQDKKNVIEDGVFKLKRRESLSKKPFKTRTLTETKTKAKNISKGMSTEKTKAKIKKQDDFSDDSSNSVETLDSSSQKKNVEPKKPTTRRVTKTNKKPDSSSWNVLQESLEMNDLSTSMKEEQLNDLQPSSPRPLAGYSLADRLKSRAQAVSAQAEPMPSLFADLTKKTNSDTSRRQQTLDDLLGISSGSTTPVDVLPEDNSVKARKRTTPANRASRKISSKIMANKKVESVAALLSDTNGEENSNTLLHSKRPRGRLALSNDDSSDETRYRPNKRREIESPESSASKVPMSRVKIGMKSQTQRINSESEIEDNDSEFQINSSDDE